MNFYQDIPVPGLPEYSVRKRLNGHVDWKHLGEIFLTTENMNHSEVYATAQKAFLRTGDIRAAVVMMISHTPEGNITQ